MSIAKSLKSAVNRILKASIRGVDTANNNRLDYIRELSPTRSGSYISSHKVKPARFLKGEVVGGVYNKGKNTDPSKVEDGWRRSPVNWHKGPPATSSTVIHTGKGAKVYERANQNTDLISKSFERSIKNI